MQDKKKIQANAAILFCKFELENTIDRIRNVGDSLSLNETNIEDAKETLAKLYKYILQLIDTAMPNLIYLGDTLEIMKMEEMKKVVRGYMIVCPTLLIELERDIQINNN